MNARLRDLRPSTPAADSIKGGLVAFNFRTGGAALESRATAASDGGWIEPGKTPGGEKI